MLAKGGMEGIRWSADRHYSVSSEISILPRDNTKKKDFPLTNSTDISLLYQIFATSCDQCRSGGFENRK